MTPVRAAAPAQRQGRRTRGDPGNVPGHDHALSPLCWWSCWPPGVGRPRRDGTRRVVRRGVVCRAGHRAQAAVRVGDHPVLNSPAHHGRFGGPTVPTEQPTHPRPAHAEVSRPALTPGPGADVDSRRRPRRRRVRPAYPFGRGAADRSLAHGHGARNTVDNRRAIKRPPAHIGLSFPCAVPSRRLVAFTCALRTRRPGPRRARTTGGGDFARPKEGHFEITVRAAHPARGRRPRDPRGERRAGPDGPGRDRRLRPRAPQRREGLRPT